MAHSHAHAHGEGEGTYFLDQLFTILAAGSLGVVAILMYQTGMLSRILVPMFFKPVLIGGVAILALAIIRAVAVWQLAGARRQAQAEAADHGHEHGQAHGHEHGHAHGPEHGHSHGHAHGHEDAHSHGEDCGHDHAHEGACDHDHSHSHAHSQASDEDDHGHSHGWAPWRYMVIAIPVFLYFLGLPREGFETRPTYSGSLSNPNRKAMSLLAGGPAMTKVLRKGEPRELRLGFKELAEAAAMPARHDAYEGDIGIIRGEFAPMPGTNHEFTLVRWNMTCCRADAIMLETRIIAPDPVRIDDRQWVQVSGVISFERTEKGKWIPVLTLRSNDDIVPTEMTQNADAF